MYVLKLLKQLKKIICTSLNSQLSNCWKYFYKIPIMITPLCQKMSFPPKQQQLYLLARKPFWFHSTPSFWKTFPTGLLLFLIHSKKEILRLAVAQKLTVEVSISSMEDKWDLYAVASKNFIKSSLSSEAMVDLCMLPNKPLCLTDFL